MTDEERQKVPSALIEVCSIGRSQKPMPKRPPANTLSGLTSYSANLTLVYLSIGALAELIYWRCAAPSPSSHYRSQGKAIGARHFPAVLVKLVLEIFLQQGARFEIDMQLRK